MSTPTSYTLLAGGYRNTLAALRFTPPPTAASRETPGATTASGTLALISESPVPPNPSWLEVKNENVYTVSEVEGGTAVLAELVREEGAVVGVNVRQEVVVGDAPCHVAFEGDVVVVSNYLSGTLTTLTPALSPLSTLALPYAYAGDTETPPNPQRQEKSHAHHALATARGLLVCDLGSDRVYVVKGGEVLDWIQCEKGFGPRHCVVDADGETLYILGELSHRIVAYPLTATKDTPPLRGTRISYLPMGVDPDTPGLDGAELVSPASGTVYASNRLQLHVDPACSTAANANAAGDSIKIILFPRDTPHPVPHFATTDVPTPLCCIRGMTLSPDARFLAVAGQCKGGIQIYAVGGERKEELALVASADVQGVTDFAWL